MSQAEAVAYHTDPDTGHWIGACDGHGYPQMSWQGNTVLVHRAVARLAGLSIEGKVVMHDDDNPLNVSISNLRVGTQAENMADMSSKGRGKTGARIKDAEAADIIRAYREGKAITQIAKDTGRSYRALRRFIKRHKTRTAHQDTAQASFSFPK